MSTRNYTRTAGRMGGSGKTVVHGHTPSGMSPEVARDCQVVNNAFARFRDTYLRRVDARHAAGLHGTKYDHIWSWFKQYILLYNRRPSRLSAKMRRFCLGVLGLKEMPPVVVTVPEGLRFLPKRPPTRVEVP